MPDGEADAGAGRADDRHLEAGAHEREPGHASLGHADEEEREQRAGQADGERRVQAEEEVRPQRDDGGDEVREADREGIAEGRAAGVGGDAELLLDLRAQKDVRIGRESARDRLGLGTVEPFALEDEGQLGRLAFREIVDLLALGAISEA